MCAMSEIPGGDVSEAHAATKVFGLLADWAGMP